MNRLSSSSQTKQRLLRVAPLALLCTVFVFGCKESPPPWEATRQGVKVRIICPGGHSNIQHNGRIEGAKQIDKDVVGWEGTNPGKVEVVIEDLHLQVDGRDYGMVKTGDVVTVDATKERAVTVNDQERQPAPKK
jgi:hypothetical protein